MKTLATLVSAVACAALIGACERPHTNLTDGAINNEVRRQLNEAKLPGTIEPVTTNGTVMLSGTVPDNTAKVKAGDITQRVAGVSKVQNNLRVTAAGDAPGRPAVNLPAAPPADSQVPPEPERR